MPELSARRANRRKYSKRGKGDNEIYTYEKILEKSKKEEEISIVEEDDISVPSFRYGFGNQKIQ